MNFYKKCGEFRGEFLNAVKCGELFFSPHSPLSTCGEFCVDFFVRNAVKCGEIGSQFTIGQVVDCFVDIIKLLLKITI